jgi:small subunit ribosomal protein S2
VIALVDSNSDPSVLSHPIPGNDDSTKSIRIIIDVILDAIQSGASKRVQAPTKRKDITPVAQEPDFLENEDEPEVTLPEGYDEMDFDDRKKAEQANESEDNSDSTEEEPSAVSEADAEKSDEPASEEPVAEEAKS